MTGSIGLAMTASSYSVIARKCLGVIARKCLGVIARERGD